MLQKEQEEQRKREEHSAELARRMQEAEAKVWKHLHCFDSGRWPSAPHHCTSHKYTPTAIRSGNFSRGHVFYTKRVKLFYTFRQWPSLRHHAANGSYSRPYRSIQTDRSVGLSIWRRFYKYVSSDQCGVDGYFRHRWHTLRPMVSIYYSIDDKVVDTRRPSLDDCRLGGLSIVRLLFAWVSSFSGFLLKYQGTH